MCNEFGSDKASVLHLAPLPFSLTDLKGSPQTSDKESHGGAIREDTGALHLVVDEP